MKIKTVCEEINVETIPVFDERVNVLLEDGWQLAKRETIPGYDLGGLFFPPSLYAELVKLEEADMEPQESDPITWQEAADVLRDTCQGADDCSEDGCLMFAWCQKNLPAEPPPANWADPEELEQPE